ncbi:hypothetical protein Dsin_011858 [Dipteronia sinensis]|uniref:Pentatricopeptide repeat-containing protein n=1 Tax=Dipteronia sinensis TaxID=43782 RepID=A0AAE0AGX2_9ROSI|nr:hypothetical protein Dsin_011858 [Dipteronia sinensis]
MLHKSAMKLPCILLLRSITARHISRRQSSSSPSTTSQSAFVNEVVTILNTIRPIESALESLVPFLSPDIISSIIKETQNPQLGFRFYIWATNRKRLLSLVSRNLVVNMLLEPNGFDLYWTTLEELKESGVPVTSSAFDVLISGYAKAGACEKVLESFGKMKEFDCVPDVFVYNTILHAVLRKQVYLMALALYNQMLKLNCMPTRHTFNILIGGLCKSGKIQDALKLFDEMMLRGVLPNRFTYTIVISGLCLAKRADDAHRLFIKMKNSGCSPDFVAYNALLNGFCKLGRVDEAFALLRSFEKEDDFKLQLRGYSSLIDGLFRARRYDEAYAWYRKMFEVNIEPDVVLYTVMIRGLSDAGKVKDAVKLMDEMNERGVAPDTYCYNAVIKGFCDAGLLNQARSLQLEILKRDSFPDTCTHTILICGMCKNGLVVEAEQIFNDMEKVGCLPSVVTFNALIDGLCKAGELEKANLLFYKMEIGRNPSLFLRLSQGANRVLDSASLQTMVEQYCESGLVLKAYKILMQLADSGNVPDLITYNILINGFCRAGKINGALKLFKELQVKGLSPDSVTYGTLITGLLRIGREEDAFKIFDQMAKNGCTPSQSVYKTLMTWSCRRSKVTLAFTLWLKYLRGISGREDEAIKVIEEHFAKGDFEKGVRGLLEMDFKLNDFNLGPYTIWLIGLCQAGLVGEGLKIFSILNECKVIVTPPSCVKLIHALCKRGKLDEAMDVFLYTVKNGFKLMPRVCNYLLRSILLSKDGKHHAYDLLSRMESLGYDLDSHLYGSTKVLLSDPWNRMAMENASPG